MALAIEHGFEEPLPAAVVLDADFVVSVLHEGEEFHDDCARFAARLHDSKVAIVHTQLLRLEFLAAWRNAARRSGMPTGLLPRQARLVLDLAAEREALYELGDGYFSDLLDQYDTYEVRLSARLQDRARKQMATYNLRPMDACLVAAAFRTDVPHVVSLDKDFLRVDGLHLWNDHIPERRERKRRARRR